MIPSVRHVASTVSTVTVTVYVIVQASLLAQTSVAVAVELSSAHVYAGSP